MTGQANLQPLDDTETGGAYELPKGIANALRRRAAGQLADDMAGHARDAAYIRRRREWLLDMFLQAGIAVFTTVAVWLITSDSPHARWGHVVGLVSQPFYVAASWRARQWGMFFVAIALCGLWARGIGNNFF